ILRILPVRQVSGRNHPEMQPQSVLASVYSRWRPNPTSLIHWVRDLVKMPVIHLSLVRQVFWPHRLILLFGRGGGGYGLIEAEMLAAA
ncbi:MAG: hypothetical protein VX664_04865, partial [Chloroflexota bacterium]|nr:hypothetical protein [Chloroflexota bacterium]